MLVLKERQYPEEQIREMMDRKNRYYLEFIQQIRPRDLLEEIRAAGLKSALGSASRNAPQVVERLGIADLLDAISDGHSVERQKPAPDLFLHAAAQLGWTPPECVVVEDAAAGIEAAHAGGFRSVGLGPRERVSRADLILPSLESVDLRELLTALDKQQLSG